MSYPTDPGFESIEITDNEAVFMSEAQSLQTNARSIDGHRWEISGTYPLLTRAQAATVMAYIKSVRGSSSTFTLVLPEYSNANGTVSGTVLANGAAAAGATSVTIDGITGQINAGDFVKFANHNKVYMVTADRNGAGAMSISPPLREAVADNEGVTYDAVPFTVRLSRDKNRQSIGTENRTRITVDFIEAT